MAWYEPIVSSKLFLVFIAFVVIWQLLRIFREMPTTYHISKVRWYVPPKVLFALSLIFVVWLAWYHMHKSSGSQVTAVRESVMQGQAGALPRTQQDLWSEEWSTPQKSGTPEVSGSGRPTPWARLFLWLGIVIGLPWATSSLIERTVLSKSNGKSLMLLLGYSAAGLLLWVLLMGTGGLGGAQLASGLLLLLLCLGYNFWACEFQASRRLGVS